MRAAGNEADAVFLSNEKLNSTNLSVHGFSKARLKTLVRGLIQTEAKASNKTIECFPVSPVYPHFNRNAQH